MSDIGETKHVLIVNQHGENRGDESAMRAMINSFEKKFGKVKFTVIAQFRDKNLDIKFNQNVKILHMIMPIHHAIGMVIYSLCKYFRVEPTALLSSQTKEIIRSYESATIVISAPGGPYFGDIYINHEIVHWFYIWLSFLHQKQVFLYAPSAGPFKNKLMNLIRKYFYRKFSSICIREEISKTYLQELLGHDIKIHLTADSALQESIEPYQRSGYFTGSKAACANKFLVSLSAIEYKYPGKKNVGACQRHYDQIIVQCLRHIETERDCHFLFFPQLYGHVHSDVPYLQKLGESLPSTSSWEIIDPVYDSDMQRRLLGMTDLCIASRYHPQIFAASSGTPGICIYYEHKALAFMDSLGLKDFAFDINQLDFDTIRQRIDEAIDRHDELVKLLKKNVSILQKQAQKTTQLVIEHLEQQAFSIT